MIEPTFPRPAALPALRLEQVASLTRLRDVAREWDDLWARAPDATPFSSPAWLLPWCEHLLEGNPWALLAWRGDHLVGLLPALVYERGGARVVGLLGGGVSDYQDLLAVDDAVAEALVRGLVDGATEADLADVADLEALPPWSPLLRVRTPEAARGTTAAQETCPVLPLAGGMDGVAARASPQLLSDVRYRQRRLARRGGYEVVRADATTLDEVLAALFRLHRARWAARGEPGVLRGERLERFHRDAARGLLARGVLRLYALRGPAGPIGVLHGLSARGRFHAYISALDPAAAPHSPGSLLFAHAIEQAIAEGCRELDFLRGREAYKYRWGAEDRATSRLVLHLRRGADAAAASASAPTSAR